MSLASSSSSAKIVSTSSDGNYNLNAVLAGNIRASDYFKSLYEFKTYHEVRDEIVRRVKDLEPHIRGMGILYLRFVCEPDRLWEWLAPYVDDTQEIMPSKDKNMTIGEYIRFVLTKRDYFGTLLPRIPVTVERDIKKRLLGGGSFISSKKPISAEFLREMLKPGLLIKAQYYEDAKYYPAIIDDFLPDGKILVTFSDYGNQEKVALGGIRLIEERQTHQGYQSKIEREILDQERRQATAKGKDYTRRPTGVSTAITMNLQPSLGKKRDEFASPNREDVIVVQSSMTNKEENVPKKKYKMSEEARSRLKALKEKYGDASSKIDSNQL